MKLDWQHIVLILLAVTSAASPFASQAAHGQPIDTGALVAAAFALVTTIGALLKASIVPSVNTAAAVKDAAVKIAGAAFMAACVGMLVLAQGCAWFKANEATLTADGEALAACIVGEALSGDTSAITIGVKCGAPAGFDVLGFVGQLLTALKAPSDASTVGGAQSSTKADVIAALRAVK